MRFKLYKYLENPGIEKTDVYPTPWGDFSIGTDKAGIILTARWINARESVFNPLPQYEGVALVAPTRFAEEVFKKLLTIRPGETITYSDLARLSGYPGAARAVGNLMAGNDKALFLPCHRVVPACGGVGKYRWGEERKRAILNFEKVRLPFLAQASQYRHL